ncbi:hypothetical protein Taro_005593 [Colocasia esculenta]|uniref:RNA polymerase sigma-70 region 2 domain-containing protein n=1 Tax=Colocasia esculenta TaxID=4460 RepID=A0A843TYB2_COLES|nr:hypothetical protein [Colocasia esculenta]
MEALEKMSLALQQIGAIPTEFTYNRVICSCGANTFPLRGNKKRGIFRVLLGRIPFSAIVDACPRPPSSSSYSTTPSPATVVIHAEHMQIKEVEFMKSNNYLWDESSEFAILSRSGKSSLINALICKKEVTLRSKNPGCERFLYSEKLYGVFEATSDGAMDIVPMAFSSSGKLFSAQEGCIGLLRGAEIFDSKQGYKLRAYVYWWIKQAIIKAIAKKSRIVRLSITVKLLSDNIWLLFPSFLILQSLVTGACVSDSNRSAFRSLRIRNDR